MGGVVQWRASAKELDLHCMSEKTEIGLTQLYGAQNEPDRDAIELLEQFEEQIASQRIAWSTSLRLCELKGSGSQGSVFKGQRVGADGFRLPVAIKYYSPEIFGSALQYDAAMADIGQVAAVVAKIQHENLVVVSHFLNHNRIRVMVMEWIDGYDLRQLLTSRMCGSIRQRCSRRRWEHLNSELFCSGPVQPRLKAATVRVVLRDCLSALSALHEEGVLHNDLKPANVMLNRAGRAKIIDMGSATQGDSSLGVRTFSPAYCAPEILSEGAVADASCDIASLGYMAIEMLTGLPTYDGQDLKMLIREKHRLPSSLETVLCNAGVQDPELALLLKRMIAPVADLRFRSADDAIGELLNSSWHDTDTTRENMRIWIEELLEFK